MNRRLVQTGRSSPRRSLEACGGSDERCGGSLEKGASLVEYSLLLALILVVCLVPLKCLGHSADNKLKEGGHRISGSMYTP